MAIRPGSRNESAAVQTTQVALNARRKRLRYPPRSAIAPSSGERRATVTAVTATAVVHVDVRSLPVPLMYFTKYVL